MDPLAPHGMHQRRIAEARGGSPPWWDAVLHYVASSRHRVEAKLRSMGYNTPSTGLNGSPVGYMLRQMEARIMRTTSMVLRTSRSDVFSHVFVHDAIFVENKIPSEVVLASFEAALGAVGIAGPKIRIKDWGPAVAKLESEIGTAQPAYKPADTFRDIQRSKRGAEKGVNVRAGIGGGDIVTWLHHGRIPRGL